MTDAPSDDAPVAPPTDVSADQTADVSVDPTIDVSADQTADVSVDLDGSDTVDLDAVERDLAAVEAALDRLSDGTYWIDEVTGEPLPEELLAADPTARRVVPS